ncbi:hypothetical protein SAMN05518672_108139 [Chitinophaga sp. CF118]|nr:hypothetical protein SAMN05518672_108139 [Chitinophaga sp. CF118]
MVWQNFVAAFKSYAIDAMLSTKSRNILVLQK